MSDEPLQSRYDALLLDLDGVVYVGPQPVPAAVEAITAAREAGLGTVFVTNNANRPAPQVAEHLASFGMPVTARDVVTSAQVAARLVREQLGSGAKVLPIGGPGVRLACEEQGLTLVTTAADRPDAVVQGYGPDVSWKDLAEAAYACHGGARYVATNTDMTIPTDRGIAPGNGSLVAAVRQAIDQEPIVAGKPEPAAFWTAATATGAERPLVIGDRLDTDIAGGNAAGYDTLLVLTGVHGTDDLLAAEPGVLPTHVAADLSALRTPMPTVTVQGDHASCGPAGVMVVDGEIIRADDERHPDPVALLRATLELRRRSGRAQAPDVSGSLRALLP